MLVSTITQRIDVSNLAGMIDGGSLDFMLSAWLGGYLNQNDTATVIARFRDATNNEIGMAQLAAVTAAQRGNVTSLLFREQFGDFPALTRFVDIELIANRGQLARTTAMRTTFRSIFALTGDLDFDASIDSVDWALFRNGQHVDMTGFTRSQSLALGDLNGDFRNDFTDFQMFKSAFESFNGSGSFAAMLTQVPEPSAIPLATVGVSISSCVARRRKHRAN